MSCELDLHGCDLIEAVETFINFYNARVSRGDCSRIDVIHGYGSSGEGGAIRIRIRNFLERNADYLTFEPGERFAPVNPGKTMVFPRRVLPSVVDLLAEEILTFCSAGKTASKITGKFRRHGEARVMTALKNLEKQSLLTSFYKGQYKHYQTRQTA